MGLMPHLLLAPRKIAPVSNISAMKVDTPRCWQSPAPTRAKMASRGAMRALSAGTKHPTWAISTNTPTCDTDKHPHQITAPNRNPNWACSQVLIATADAAMRNVRGMIRGAPVE
jgi:hypothetical protein